MYSNNTYQTGREQFFNTFTLLINQILFNFSIFSKPITGISILLLPTFFIGCSESVPPCQEDIGSPYSAKTFDIKVRHIFKSGGTLDILAFNNDRLKRLDSYQRIENFSGNTAYPSSTEGEKIFFLYYGSIDDRYGWAEINSMSSLSKVTCDLENERKDNPVMTGQCSCSAGTGSISIDLSPLACQVRLTELQCDFSGTAYAGSMVTDVKAYLTNVNATSSIVPEFSNTGTRLINVGMLNSDDLEGFEDPSVVMQEITDELGLTIIKPDATFLCYPGQTDSGRTTRLVIEGKIEGQTYYWPIEAGDEEGLLRGCSYEYRILLRRKGTTDPEIIIDRRNLEVYLNVKPWEEKENYYVGF